MMGMSKKKALGAAGLLALLILIVLGLKNLSDEQKEVARLKDQRNEMMSLKADLLLLAGKVQTVETKKGLSNVKGIAEAVEEVFAPVGLKEKVKAVKSTGQRETKDGFEEEADITLEKVSMNEMVNIFYRIEHMPMVLSVKNITIKKSFDNPELLNISLGLSFLKTK